MSLEKKIVPTSPTPPEKGLSRPGYITANPVNYKVVKQFRDDLKRNPTPAEKALWTVLKNNQIGFKFRRQHIISNLIVDFVCLRQKLVIEVDGKIHLSQLDQDMVRTARLNVKGYSVIRFLNDEVLENPQNVALKIKSFIESKNSESIINSPPLEGLGEV